MITFEDVKQKYTYSIEHMDFCRAAALSDEFPPHATWLHPPTLARWLYGSISEFAQEYKRTADKLEKRTPEQFKLMSDWKMEIDKRSWQSREEIISKYPELKEVIVS